jgi:hypothetical protein
MRMRLQDGGAGAHDFPPLAASVPRSTDLTQATRGFRAVRGLGQSALTGGLARAVHIEDQPLAALSIPQPAQLLLFPQWASQQIGEKERAQGFDGFGSQRG